MKKFLIPVLVLLGCAASFVVLAAVSAEWPEEPPPEFYFTRLVYSENGMRSRWTMAKPDLDFICPEFGGGRFFPRQGWGWATDYPGGDCKFMGAVHRLTGIRVHPNPNVIEIMDEDLFKFPFVYAVEVGGYVPQ